MMLVNVVLGVSLVLVAVTVAPLFFIGKSPNDRSALTKPPGAGLHHALTRLRVTRTKAEIRREAARLRQELARELRDEATPSGRSQ
jgi:hypothetical protein